MTRRWVARRVVVEEGEGREDTACGLHAASSSSLPPFALLPTLLTLLQPSQLVVVVFHVVAGVGNMGAEGVGWWGGAWDCGCRRACPGLAHIWALTKALDGGSGWPHSGGGGVRKEVEVVVLAT